MKILEGENEMLTNYEVLTHIQEMRERYDRLAKKRGKTTSMKSGNLETVMKELVDYLQTPPSPLVAAHKYTSTTVTELCSRLRPRYKLEKPELLMILNLRPSSSAELDVVIEEMDQRFPEEAGMVDEIMGIIKEVLGAAEETGEDKATERTDEGDEDP